VQLVESGCGERHARLAREVGERRAAPQRQRLAERRRRLLGMSCGELVDAPGGEPLEAAQIQVLLASGDRIATPAGDDRRGPERPAQVGDVPLKRVRGGLGWTLSPELVDEARRRQRLAGMCEEQGEHGPLQRPPEARRLPVDERLDGSQDPVLDRDHVTVATLAGCHPATSKRLLSTPPDHRGERSYERRTQ
jgi:hypothetical protein